jgi:hypothetical protein
MNVCQVSQVFPYQILIRPNIITVRLEMLFIPFFTLPLQLKKVNAQKHFYNSSPFFYICTGFVLLRDIVFHWTQLNGHYCDYSDLPLQVMITIWLP